MIAARGVWTRPRKTTVDITGEIHSMIPTDTYRKRYDMIDWGDNGAEQSGRDGTERTGRIERAERGKNHQPTGERTWNDR
jgi:hypothetical protein